MSNIQTDNYRVVNDLMEHNPVMKIPYDYLKSVHEADVRKKFKDYLKTNSEV